MKKLVALFLLLSLLLSLPVLPVSADSDSKTVVTPPFSTPSSEDLNADIWNIPTLADTVIRAGRSTIKQTADHWSPYLTVTEATAGLTFSFQNAVNTVFEGISHSVSLDGLYLKFSSFRNYVSNASAPATFAISFGAGEYARFGFGLIFDPANGRVFAGQASGSSMQISGEALLEDPSLTAAGLENQEWTLLMSKEFDGNYTLAITVGTRVLSATVKASVVENGSYDPTDCCFNIMALKNSPTFSLTLEGWKQLPRPALLKEADTLLLGSGSYDQTLSDWLKWLKVTQIPGGGLHYEFTNAAHSVAEGITTAVSLDGLRLYFSNLSTTDTSKLGRIALTFSTGGLVRSCFGLIFEFGKGNIYAANGELSNGTVSTGRVSAVGAALFSGEAFRYENMAGKDWCIDFSSASDGNYEVAIVLDGERYCTTVPSSVVKNCADFRPDDCYPYLMSAQNNTTLNVDFVAINNRCGPVHVDNSDLLPAYVPSTEVSVDRNGTPIWLESAIIMEVNIPRVTKEGTLDAAVPVLDHIREMGVNCIWVTSVGEPGTKNDGTDGNHYVNLGLQSIDPAITGAADYEAGWKRFAHFVEEAHKRNIYVIFNVITWGTTKDSPIYQQHPEWYTGAEIWGGKAWDWGNSDFKAWYQDTLLELIETTNIDGLLYDCEPSYAGADNCAALRRAIRNSGRNLVYIGENANERRDAYDMEQYGVMSYSGYSTTSAAIGAHQKDDKEFFVEEGYNIVDAIQNGTITGTPAQQSNQTGGTYRYYTYNFSNHDSYYFSFQNNLLDVGYQGIFSSYIPMWYLGDEFYSTPSGIRLYFDKTKWCNLTINENRDFYEKLKALLRIRREYDDIFEYFPSNHRNTNICKVDTTGDLNLQAYARYYDNTGIVIVGNRNADGAAVTSTVTIPFESMNLSKYDRFTVTDLLTGELLCSGTKRQVERVAVTLDYDALGVYAVVGSGTANEGLTVANASHALLRNGTAHQINTATVSWSKYVQVEEAPLNNGLRFSFTNAVTTTCEGINVPISLENLYLQLDNLSGYENHGTSADPSRIALSFGPGGYERNSFGLIFDFANGAIYAAKATPGSTDRLTRDNLPLIANDLLKASSLTGKEWSVQLSKQADGNYLLTLTACGSEMNAVVDSSYIAATDSFDPASCYLYFAAAGGTPTVSFDLVGWGSAAEAMTYFNSGDVQLLTDAEHLQLREDAHGKGLHLDFHAALPLTTVRIVQGLNLDGTTLYFDNLSNYRDYSTKNGSTKYAVTFASADSETTALGIVLDPMYGRVYLCLNGYLYRQLLSDTALTYNHFRDVQWSMSFTQRGNGSLDLILQLPDGSYTANISADELAEARGFRADHCNVNLMSWDGPLNLSLTLSGYQRKKEATPYYTVAFVNEDGTLLQTKIVYEGETASYTGRSLTKPCDADTHYEHVGWDRKLTNITANTTFTAKFETAAHCYNYSEAEGKYICQVCEYRSASCGHEPNYAWDVDGDDTLEILAIGNSFSTDALWYTWQIARDMGIEKIVIGNLYIADCSLNTHATNAANDSAAYLYYYNDSGSWSTTSEYKISTALTDRSWDYISIQQNPGQSGVESSYNEDLTYLIGYVKGFLSDKNNQNRNICTKLVWHMTWAFQQDSTHTAFVNYDHGQMTMYNRIVSAVQNKICTNEDIDLIVPSGTAIQNARTSLIGDTLTRDGYHMSLHYGRFLTGMMFMKAVTGLSVDEISYMPGDVTELYREIAKESVNHAYSTPFAVTQSAFTGNAPTEGYLLLQPERTKGAYWNPTSENSYNRLIKNANNSNCFFATVRFTKEDLPVGSIIMLADGWQYRPDGWVTDRVHTTREGITTAPYVVVTEEWWKDYTIRAFNISKVGVPSLEDVAEEELFAAFRIYVPEDCHTHSYTSVVTAPTCSETGFAVYTCPVCGDSRTEVIAATGHSYGYSNNRKDHTVACANCGDSYTEEHSYVDGVCVCGAAEVIEPVVDGNIKINHTLNLASDISVSLVVHRSLLAGFDMDTVYVLAEIEVYEGNTKTGTETIKLLPVEQGNYYYFTLTKLTALSMNDRIRSILYGTKDGQPYCSATDDYSIADYAYSQMNKSGVPASLKTLCADLLRYGAKAQIFKSYRTDHLADASMTEEQRGVLSDIEAVSFGNNNVVLQDLDNAAVTWTGKTLDLVSKVTLKLVFDPGAYSGNTETLTLHISYLSFDGENKEVIVTDAEPYNSQTGLFAFSFDGLLAAELRSVVSAQIYAGDKPVSCTLQYSADTYGNNKSGTLLDLCKALFAYSDSAKNYFGR